MDPNLMSVIQAQTDLIDLLKELVELNSDQIKKIYKLFSATLNESIKLESRIRDLEAKKEARVAINVDPNEKVTVARGMANYGGSFVRNLGNALYCADGKNAEKIKNTFPEYWEKYKKVGEIKD